MSYQVSPLSPDEFFPINNNQNSLNMTTNNSGKMSTADPYGDLYKMGNQYSFEAPKTASTSRITTTGQPLPINPMGSVSTSTRITPSGPQPTMGELPELIIPKIDEAQISGLTRKLADPAIRSLSRTAKIALMKHYDNPNVAKMVAREALAGYGQSLASALSSAGTQARGEERENRQIETSKAMTEYQAKINRQNTVYEAAWNNYMAQYGTKTSTQYIYPKTESGEEKEGYVPEINYSATGTGKQKLGYSSVTM